MVSFEMFPINWVILFCISLQVLYNSFSSAMSLSFWFSFCFEIFPLARADWTSDRISFKTWTLLSTIFSSLLSFPIWSSFSFMAVPAIWCSFRRWKFGFTTRSLVLILAGLDGFACVEVKEFCLLKSFLTASGFKTDAFKLLKRELKKIGWIKQF